MPFSRLEDVDLDIFWYLNPDPAELAVASPDCLPAAQPLKPGLPALVFLHVSGGTALGFARQLADPRLRERFNLVAIDCPLHGFSRSTYRTEHTLEDSAKAVIRILDELQLSTYSIYGEGPHGANIAAWIAAKRVEQVQGLVLASPGWPVESADVAASLHEIKEAMSVNCLDERGDRSGTFPADALEEITIYFLGDTERLREDRKMLGEYFQQRYGTGRPSYEFRFLFSFIYERKRIPTEQLEKVRAPVLCLRGGADSIVCPDAACEEWVCAFPNARNGAQCVTVADAHNILSMAEGGIVARIVSQFLHRSLAEAARL
ncbi:uncharacterized protein RHOBADRAFT_55987 [Rhodotorula graminis WP1]|uniref:AB hydrolase-1 domain-containing protein n=1 Tax=Rhodotorula graminis (strain WP1) TaxID=578459 RepID=A0A0P9EKF1_RHOGW|nr:uncharacterized protein RHOBADRAFT_55987 [Rhodotorula graminis WP1]KPV72153.1 hypothetical protein RHOBADRAFT_55987 [Rhodotorula graminis WP1]